MTINFRRIPGPERNPLVPVVRPLSPIARQALLQAANRGVLRRGSWQGCAFNIAGAEVGTPVRSRGEAACAFSTSPEDVRRFIEVWDGIWGSNRYCTALLRNALVHVGMAERAGAATVRKTQDSLVNA
jgi:hypothetical protein